MDQMIQKRPPTIARNYTPAQGRAKPGIRADEASGQSQKTSFRRFLRFCVVGTSNAVIDFGVLNALLWFYPTSDTWKTLGYNSLAVLLASTNSFFWNKYWTFQQRSRVTFQEVYRFIVVAGATTLMNDLLMLLFGKMFSGVMSSNLIGANLLKFGAIVGTMSISFFGMQLWVFFQKKRTADTLALADHATIKLPAMSSIYDMNTIITAAIRPGHTINPIGMRPPEMPGIHDFAANGSYNQPQMSVPLKTLIIIPTYNERENLPTLLHQIFTYAPATDVLVVDDNSPDGTGMLVEEMRQRDARIRVLHRAGKLGLGTAYISGFKFAIEMGYDAIFEMDADFSHDPRYLPDFLKAIEQADLVIGSRYIPGGSTPNWSAQRRLISGSGNIFARMMLGIPVHDCTGGFRCYRRYVLQKIDLDAVQSRGYAFQVELTYRTLKQGFKISEIPITFLDRRLGTSKMSRKIVVEAFTYVLRTRFSKSSFERSVHKQQNWLGRLRVENGAEAGHIYEVRKESFSIGRIGENDLSLNDSAISRLHASIVCESNGNYYLIDEGSANGTKMNGQLLEKYVRYPLNEGDKIQFGETILVWGQIYVYG